MLLLDSKTAMGQKQGKPDFKELSKGTKFTTKELKEWFNKFKGDFPQGKISKPEFVNLYKKMFGSDGDPQEFCEHVFRQYDADGNGEIDFREFVTTLSVAARGTADEKLLWAFNLYDIDGNHYLSPSEITEILQAVYKAKKIDNPREKAEETVTTIFTKADDNKDGRLSEAEFVRHALTCPSVKELLQAL